VAGDLLGRRHWIFDLDGTLTRPVHDFAEIRRELGVPAGAPILEHLERLPAGTAAPLRERLDAIERGLCDRAVAQPGVAAWLADLAGRGTRLGILTRNRRDHALRTLTAAGLGGFFPLAEIVGRDEATPKPSPAGIRRLLQGWGAAAGDCVMVGDFLFDLQAARAAGVLAVYLDWDGGGRWTAEADLTLAGVPQR